MMQTTLRVIQDHFASAPGSFLRRALGYCLFLSGSVFCLSSAFAEPPAPSQPEATEAVSVETAPAPTPAPTPATEAEIKIKARPKPMAKESRRSKRRKPTQAERGTLTGARLIPFRSQAVRASLGFPDIEIAYHFPYTPEIELIPRLQLAYGRNLSTAPSIMELGSDARKEIYKKGKWTVAGYASAFMHLNMNEQDPVHYAATSGFGIGLGCPGAIATYAHNSDFDINLGVQIQDIIYLGDNSGLELNIPFSVGFEYEFSKDIRIFQKTEFGPDIYVGEKTELHLRTYLGAGYGF